ncbi:hypothetical protein Anas_12833 [Armadillidium nasatum]|uniref:Uncharacterized protein n=1 Tax=Armadillidium nasatum TaxID=96803 RepID=A0A5N5TGM9_9CRUS|nr:hypothetical protein Anas_12833 [Armadillidium nasatum]
MDSCQQYFSSLTEGNFIFYFLNQIYVKFLQLCIFYTSIFRKRRMHLQGLNILSFPIFISLNISYLYVLGNFIFIRVGVFNESFLVKKEENIT